MRKSSTGILLFVLIVLPSLAYGFVSTNVRLDHWAYDAIDKLTSYGLIDSAIMTTKPVSRLEMARLIARAMEKAQQLKEENEIILSLIDRLKAEFKAELATIGALDGDHIENFVKPVDDLDLRYVLANKKPDLENQRGDIFNRNSNYRVGFASRMTFFDTAALYVHPEYHASSSENGDIDLIEAYGKLAFGAMEVEIGRDSLWWGPGHHGSLIMSNNVEPFTMLKISNPNPVQLPWILSGLGLFKATWFLTELEEDRANPEPKLTGLRLNFKPHPAFDIGLSRTIMFGGDALPGVSKKDYFDIFQIRSEQPQTNQLAGGDISILIPLSGKMPVKSINLYAERIGEDEAGGLPTKCGNLFGMKLNDIFRTGRTDFLVEYANNHVSGSPNVFYTHPLFQPGYTYKGRIMGHHMGTDASDLFFRVSHYLKEDVILGFEIEKEIRDLSSEHHQTDNLFGVDLTLFRSNTWQIRPSYRYEDSDQVYHIFDLQLIRYF